MSTESPIGAEIRRLRKTMNLTLQEFSARIGVSLKTLHSYESGQAVPPGDKLLRIVHATRNVETPFRVGPVARAVSRAAAA